MNFGYGERRILWKRGWIAATIICAVLLFVGILVVNVAGQGYERHTFTSSNFDPTSSYSFPTNFLRASLKDKPGCEPLLIRQGDVFRTNHSLFEYKIVDVGSDSISYADITLLNCFVEEILVKNTKNLQSILPSQFGFFPKAESLITCQDPSFKLSTTFTYTNTDPLGKAQSGASPIADITFQPSTYWAQAVLIYWWDQLSVNLTRANKNNFNSSLQSVLLQALYPNDTSTSIATDSAIITSFTLTNSSQPTSFTKLPSTAFSAEHVSILNKLQIFNASDEFFASFYWALNLDLGQFSSQNIFTDASLLSDATDIFHNNVFINFTYQETPLSDGKIPGNGYRSVKNLTAPLTQTPANLQATYQCWRYVRKPSLLALIDVIVPTFVLFALLLFAFYLCISPFVRRRPATDGALYLAPINPRDSEDFDRRNRNSHQSFEQLDPEDQYINPAGQYLPSGIGRRSGGRSPSQERDSLEIDQASMEVGPSGTVYYHRVQSPREGIGQSTFQNPFSDPPQTSSDRDRTYPSRNATVRGPPSRYPSIRGIPPRHSPDVRTLASDHSIQETPIAVLPPQGLEGYRISHATEQVFNLHAERMRELERQELAREDTVRQPATWSSRLSQRRSSTDLRRMRVVK